MHSSFSLFVVYLFVCPFPAVAFAFIPPLNNRLAAIGLEASLSTWPYFSGHNTNTVIIVLMKADEADCLT